MASGRTLGDPCAGKVITLDKAAGGTFSLEELTAALEQHKPAVLFLCQASKPLKSQCGLFAVRCSEGLHRGVLLCRARARQERTRVLPALERSAGAMALYVSCCASVFDRNSGHAS